MRSRLIVLTGSLTIACALAACSSSSHAAGHSSGSSSGKLSMSQLLAGSNDDAKVPQLCAEVFGSPAEVAKHFGAPSQLYPRSYTDPNQLDCGYDLQADAGGDSAYDLNLAPASYLAPDSTMISATENGYTIELRREGAAINDRPGVQKWLDSIVKRVTR